MLTERPPHSIVYDPYCCRYDNDIQAQERLGLCVSQIPVQEMVDYIMVLGIHLTGGDSPR